ncbi:MAG TPA: asparaginase [Lachnospiraceae bacterium]|jgi:L-asparaginase|nr:asparaginase [Lachnospiraceae bacterium]HBE08697.1 asparaginase [Lachnospiraceae bacterium]
MKKKILIINTGGTLSSVAKEHGLTPDITTDSMMKELHIVAGEAELTTMDFMSLDSANIFPEDWAKLAEIISDNRDKYDGMVVIHGTDTMAYTSSMLSFMLQNIPIPVVITGSQLSISDPVADAMENLRCAIFMAQTGKSGVFLAFNRKVILGCRASKVRSISFDAFDSINAPNVAEISSLGMKVNEDQLPKKSGIFHLQNNYSRDIAVVKMFPGMHRSLLNSLAKEGCKAIYIEAYGLGGMPYLKHDFIATIQELVDQGITILIGTQCRFEGSNLNVYETGRRALDAGVIQANDMTTEAAVTKLMWVLGQTNDPKEIRDYFNISLCGEVILQK